MKRVSIFSPMLLSSLFMTVASHVVAEDNGNIAGKKCLDAAHLAASQIADLVDEKKSRLLCDENDTGFFEARIRYSFTSHIMSGGLEQLFFERTPAYLTAQSEGREIRLSYSIEPNEDYPDFWNISVKDAVNNQRLNRDFLWARDFRALDGSAPSSLLLGEPLVYFACTSRAGLTCVASYNVDKCYSIENVIEAQSKTNHHYEINIAMIGEENVNLAFSDYEPINKMAEEVLQIVSPAICFNQTE